ncbi:putative HNHc nuclease [Tissierella sp. MB52-C2]|uniref:putative HNHc nuclease n=1 Tax=Tissierella sp. MB52-C2 TaxID=3070999 RepID=UPI00280C1657|nr:putative HNHc nuclease [Tissierella sp. MB52-C2]WMM24015.1 putative HNHc nuclease [Tissierella sp. MB52-C2]
MHIPEEQVQGKIIKYRNGSSINAELKIDDGRTITVEQRKKIFATIKDIALFTGDHPEDLRAWLLYDYCIETGEIPFSLSNCSISQAREFITFIINFILKHGIPLSDEALNRTDDIDRCLWGCLKYGRCCICGRKGETYHWNAIGMGRDRSKIDDSDLRKIRLCREHLM